MSKSSKRAKSSNRDMRIIYPEYFDKNLSWRMGRRVPLRIAYEDPELKRVALAAQKAGYEVFLDSNKNYSSTWYDRKGRMLIRKVGTKEQQIREIAKNIPKVNLPKPTEKKEPAQKKQKKGSVYRQKTR
ncbi:MAG: hypothetical protein EAX90_15930 [Candidatus Heimdallarchaeota archaeon]|nr:hypothetical protein [Candidatus Heimdallarchaeota archaeon]